MPQELHLECGTRASLAYEYVTGKDIMAEYSRYPWVQQAGITTPDGLFAHWGKTESGVTHPAWEIAEVRRQLMPTPLHATLAHTGGLSSARLRRTILDRKLHDSFA